MFLLIKWQALKIVYKGTEDNEARYKWKLILNYVVFIFLVLLVGRIWFVGFKSLSTFIGLVSAGLAIALKDIILHIAGFIYILWRQPFKVGDRIQIGEFKGDVIDIKLFKFAILEIGGWVNADQHTGRIVHIPNAKLFTDPICNYSKGFKYIWNEIPVLVTFESDWKKAKLILEKIIVKHTDNFNQVIIKQFHEAARKYMFPNACIKPVVYTSIEESGVLLTIRYLCFHRQRRDSSHEIWEEILEEFSKQKDVDFAYPTRRLFNQTTESKHIINEQ